MNTSKVAECPVSGMHDDGPLWVVKTPDNKYGFVREQGLDLLVAFRDPDDAADFGELLLRESKAPVAHIQHVDFYDALAVAKVKDVDGVLIDGEEVVYVK